ncbi:MAG: glycosyltransferase [Eggerthellaceae bacterium]|nr:glycosyltransferase [Eggerthellaceae bacterium]
MADATGDAQTYLDGLLVVEGCSVEVKGLEARDGQIYAIEDDPQILLRPAAPVRALALELRFPEGYQGDGVSSYYATVVSDELSEQRVLRPPVLGKRLLTRVWEFDEAVTCVRVDLTETCGPTGISLARMAFAHTMDEGLDALVGDCSDTRGEGLVVVTHDLGLTGAPLLAARISEEADRQGSPVVALCIGQGDGGVALSYWESCIPLLELHTSWRISRDGSEGDACDMLLRHLAARGFGATVLNTVVSAQHAEVFKRAGLRVVSLIHETRETLTIHDMGDQPPRAARYSDSLVFPARSVLEGFRLLAPDIPGKVEIRPQGVYLQESCRDDGALAPLLDELGIPAGAPVILGSGTPELRKGYDLFISAAIELTRIAGDVAPYFIWAGCSANLLPGDELLPRLADQVRKSGIAGRFHRVEFLPSTVYAALLNASSVFWCTSRDDTFPSAVLEAMRGHVPVAAFAGSGGVDVMLEDGRGVLVEGFSVGELARETHRLLVGEACVDVQEARRWVAEELDFSDYVSWLRGLCAREEVVSRPLSDIEGQGSFAEASSAPSSPPDGGEDEGDFAGEPPTKRWGGLRRLARRWS